MTRLALDMTEPTCEFVAILNSRSHQFCELGSLDGRYAENRYKSVARAASQCLIRQQCDYFRVYVRVLEDYGDGYEEQADVVAYAGSIVHGVV